VSVRYLFLTIALAALSACSLPRGAALQSEVVAAADEAEAPFAVYAVTRETIPQFKTWPRSYEYYSWIGRVRGPASPVIRAGDRIDLTIWDSSENSLLSAPEQKVVDMSNISVSPAGTVFVPYLAEVYVSGQSPEAAREMLQGRIEEILPSAQVQLQYTPGSQSSVSLVGGVSSPGKFPLPDRNYSILNLISEGGGVPSGLRNPRVKLLRNGTTYEIALSKLYSDANFDTVLRGGDKVIVEQDDRYFQALGASGQEDLIFFEKDDISALEAVSIIGGITDNRADPKGVLILREYGPSHVSANGKGPSKQDVVFTVDLTSADGLFSAKRFYIEPGDVVLVTESPVTKLQTIFGLIGGVFGVANQASSVGN